jgi:hypothetical protein
VVAWLGASLNGIQNLRFQAHLYKTGEIRYIYENMGGATLTDALIGYQSAGVSTKIVDSIEVSDDVSAPPNNSMLVLSPQKWVSARPTDPLPAVSSESLMFFADASDQNIGNQIFNFNINWSDGSKDTVKVTVTVSPPAPSLTVSPATLPLSGPAGFLTKANATLTNSGDVDLNYAFTSPAAQTTKNYTWTRTPFSWNDTFNEEVFSDIADRDSGYTELSPLGFSFPYFGVYYTNFSVSVNGFISLGANATRTANQIIAPSLQDLSYDDNSRIYISGDKQLQVVTWENMSGPDGPDETFQLLLERDGTTTFQYLNLSGIDSWTKSDVAKALTYLANGTTPATAIGLKDGGSRIINDDLIWSPGPDDNRGTVITNVVVTNEEIPDPNRDYGTKTVRVTNNIVIYDTPLRSQAFSYVPKATPITVSPNAGSLAPGETQQITIFGDARDLASGASNSVTYTINSEAQVKILTINFNVSASAASELLLDSDGDGQSNYAEILAGTDERNADSTFSVNMDGSRTITWTEPTSGDRLNRTYTIWFTTNLMDGWQELIQVKNLTSYADTEHNDAPAIYYKVTID